MGAVIDWSGAVLIPPGRYTLGFVDYRTAVYFQKAAKLVLTFRVLDAGEHFGTELDRFYNVQRLTTRPGKRGGFKIGPRSDFLREYCTLFPERCAKRLDRIPITEPFGGAYVVGDVQTVAKDYAQRAIPDPVRYSKIVALLKVAGP